MFLDDDVGKAAKKTRGCLRNNGKLRGVFPVFPKTWFPEIPWEGRKQMWARLCLSQGAKQQGETEDKDGCSERGGFIAA
jgi:hypothetical protein